MTHIDNCTDCYAGQYCQDRAITAPSGVCTTGHICYENALSADPVYNNDPTGNLIIITYGDRCHPGNYCPAGTSIMIACPQGTYNQYYSGTSESASCTPCDPGKYCNGTALTEVTGTRLIFFFFFFKFYFILHRSSV